MCVQEVRAPGLHWDTFDSSLILSLTISASASHNPNSFWGSNTPPGSAVPDVLKTHSDEFGVFVMEDISKKIKLKNAFLSI